MTKPNLEASSNLARARYLNLQSNLSTLLGAGVAAGSIALSYITDQPAFAALGLVSLPIFSYANTQLDRSMRYAARVFEPQGAQVINIETRVNR